MGHGFSLTRHDGLPAYAEQLAAAGATVLVFDHRHLGDSPGEPRQRFRKPMQREDWRSAVQAARNLDGVDPAQIVLWGFSFGGGHAVATAAEDNRIAAVIALAPFIDGLARVLKTALPTVAWILPRAAADVAGRNNLIPVTGPEGSKAAMAFRGEADGFASVVPPGSPWRNEITPGVFLTVALHRPVAKAKKVMCPLWLGLGEQDITVSAKAIVRLASRAPKGELHRYPYDHWQPYVGDASGRIAADQIDFLRRQGLLGA
ncbi:MAG: alpha/beta hydrolase [Actinobacteria bacterium]|nr:alpha/beta hydrolase [Actinomycetota bacterium]